MSEAAANKFAKSLFCKVTGYCNTNDSYHQTALSDEGNGPFLAMEGALKMSGLIPSDISYINMHGTGTQNNDNAEGNALQRVFQSKLSEAEFYQIIHRAYVRRERCY